MTRAKVTVSYRTWFSSIQQVHGEDAEAIASKAIDGADQADDFKAGDYIGDTYVERIEIVDANGNVTGELEVPERWREAGTKTA